MMFVPAFPPSVADVPLWYAFLHGVGLLLVWVLLSAKSARGRVNWFVGATLGVLFLFVVVAGWRSAEILVSAWFATIFVGIIVVVARLTERQISRAWLLLLGIATLAGWETLRLGLPDVPETARRVACRDNLRSIHEAFQKRIEAVGALPDAVQEEPNEARVSWRVGMLPYLGRNLRFANYDQQAAWDTPGNLRSARIQVPEYTCPADKTSPTSEGYHLAAYALITSENTAFPGGRARDWGEMEPFSSATPLVGEASGLNIIWTEPRDIDTSMHLPGVNLEGETPDESPGVLSSFHAQMSHLLFADGRVDAVSSGMDPKVIKQMMNARERYSE